MPFPVLDSGPAFHVAFLWQDGTQTAVNTMAFQVEAGGTDTDLATALDTQYLAAMNPDTHDGAGVHTYAITPYDGVSSAVPHPVAATKWVGHTGGQWVPQVAHVISFHTGVASRSARGRIYLPFVTEGSITDGFVTSGSEVTMAAAWNTFLAAMGDDGFTPIVASTILAHTHTVHNPDGSVTRGVPDIGGLSPHGTPIVKATVGTKLATQRRRQARL